MSILLNREGGTVASTTPGVSLNYIAEVPHTTKLVVRGGTVSSSSSGLPKRGG